MDFVSMKLCNLENMKTFYNKKILLFYFLSADLKFAINSSFLWVVI
jgi:hypothetical protein